MPGRELIHIAVPTTLSAAEYTWGGGVTDEATRVKSSVVYDPRVMPRTVINDPVLTLATPDWLWVTTGMRALDHAIECAYTPARQNWHAANRRRRNLDQDAATLAAVAGRFLDERKSSARAIVLISNCSPLPA